MRFLFALVLAVVIAACQGTPVAERTEGPPATPTSPPPSQSAISTLEPTPTPEPTVRVTVPPALEAEVVISQVFFRSWVDSIASVEYQLVVEVTNKGTGPANIDSGSNDYTIYDKSGAVLETGSFSYAVPQLLGPGQVGYYIDSGFFDDGTRLKEVGQADPDTHYVDTTDSQALFPVTKVRVSAESYGDGLQVSGIVRNNTTEVADDAFVAVIFFNSNDKIIGALYENTLGQIDAGNQKGFKTSYPGTPPLKVGNVAGFKAIAFNQGFFF